MCPHVTVWAVSVDHDLDVRAARAIARDVMLDEVSERVDVHNARLSLEALPAAHPRVPDTSPPPGREARFSPTAATAA